MEFLVAPTKVLVDAAGRLSALECVRMELGEPDASGRRSPRPIPGSEHVVPADVVLAAIGQGTTVADLLRHGDFLPPGKSLDLSRWETVQVNRATFETTVPGVFSGGDVVSGAATAIEAIAAGRKAAHAIDTYLREGVARPEPREFFSRKDTFATVSVADLRSQLSRPRRSMPLVPVDERVKGFVEVELGYSAQDLVDEATRCLECGCTALFECDLRRYATEYGVEVSRFQGEARQHDRDATHPLLELDPNKCILCARCVRMCSEVVGVSAFGFVNRGFSTVVAPAMGGSLLDTDCVACGLCVATCPTGAIAEKLPLAKPGPWITKTTRSICHYCGVGCALGYESHGDTLVKVSRDEANGVTLGHHCRKGRFGVGYVHAADRLTSGRVRGDAGLEETSVAEAIGSAAERLGAFVRTGSRRGIGVFVSPRMTNEEVYLAQKFARTVLGTHNVASLASLANPSLLAPGVAATASYHDVGQAQAILLVGSNLDEEHFVVDLFVKTAIRNGAKLVSVGPTDNRTSRFAEVFLRCEADAESLVLQAVAAECFRREGRDPRTLPGLVGGVAGLTPPQVEARTGVSAAAVSAAADLLLPAVRKVVLFNRDYRGPRRRHDAALAAAIARELGCTVLPLHEKANMQGLLDMGGHPAWYPGYRAVADAAATGAVADRWGVPLDALDVRALDLGAMLAGKQIRAAVVFGEDPLGSDGLPPELRAAFESLDVLVVADVFLTKTAERAHVVLPMSAPPETSGTYTNSERRVQRLDRAVPPRAGIETWQLIAELARRMGAGRLMPYASPDEVFDEIRRVAPIYADVNVGAVDATGIWDTGRSPLPPAGPDGAAVGAVLTPRPTAALDVLDVRFERWFASLFEAAPPAPGS